MTTTISVVPAAFARAAGTFSGGRESAAVGMKALTTTLDANWGCGGSDTSAEKWCGTYDPAAFEAVNMGTAIANALGKLHDLLQANSVNHTNAEIQSSANPNPADELPLRPETTVFAAPKFKGAYGGPSNEPFGWSLIRRWVQGRVWPNGDSDKLRTVATAWRTAAEVVKGTGYGIPSARTIVGEQNSPEVPQILAQIDIVTNGITATVDQYSNLASACDNYAQALEDAHGKILALLAGFVGTAILIEGLGWALGGPLGGGGGAAAAGVEGAAIGGEIAVAIDALITAADLAALRAAGVAVAGGVLLNNVQPLLDAHPTKFDANTRPGGAEPQPTQAHTGSQVGEFDGEQAAQNLRDRLGNSGETIKNGKNVAVAEAEINGQFIPADRLGAVSGQTSPSGTVGTSGNPVFNPTDEYGVAYRPTDSEYKILEDLATRLKPDSKGVVELYTENEPCPACNSVIEQFRQRFPEVRLNVTYTNPK
ncbi:deaminase domain-containing protein [Nocardia sp. CA-129566]|uniref:deaminase domain-containing protein n=1 Tax=Nocardia sp. CA-129566 TaxID=3239976 RepID=UPI003D95AC73